MLTTPTELVARQTVHLANQVHVLQMRLNRLEQLMRRPAKPIIKLTEHTRSVLDRVSDFVIRRFGISSDMLFGRSRKREVVTIRWIAFMIALEHSKLPDSHVATYFNKDHGTLIHAKKGVSDLCETDAVFRDMLESARVEFKQTIQ